MINPNGTLKNRYHSEIMLDHAVIQLMPKSDFSLKQILFALK